MFPSDPYKYIRRFQGDQKRILKTKGLKIAYGNILTSTSAFLYSVSK